jgi:hypothetical protein
MRKNDLGRALSGCTWAMRAVMAVAASLTVACVLAAAATAAPVTGVNVLYTSNADFDQGTSVNVDHGGANANQLQLTDSTTQGTWTVTQDGGSAGVLWGKIRLNTEAAGTIPSGAKIELGVRAAESADGFGGVIFALVRNGEPFSLAGRFIQVRVTLASNGAHQTPVLSDIRVQKQGDVVVDSIGAACAGDTLTATASAHGDVGGAFELRLYESADGSTFTDTGQHSVFSAIGSQPAPYARDFDISSLNATAYKVVSDTGTESNVVSAAECSPGTDVPEAPAALLLPLSALGTFALAAGLYLRRRNAGSNGRSAS